jgi:hypothetical protein
LTVNGPSLGKQTWKIFPKLSRASVSGPSLGSKTF